MDLWKLVVELSWFSGLKKPLPIDIWKLVAEADVSKLSVAFLRRMQLTPTKPTPFMGLHAAEADTNTQGLWVGPELHLPVCNVAQASVQIQGAVDLNLLSRGQGLGALHGNFKIFVHGGQDFEHVTFIENDGTFKIDFLAPAHLFGGDQWHISASAFVVPQRLGLNEDTRQLSWRVFRIAVGDTVLVDCTSNPATPPLQNLAPPLGINLVGYLAAELGVGEAARSFARACTAVGVPYSAVDVGYQTTHMRRDTSVLAGAVKQRFAIDLMYVNADQTAATAKYLQQQGKQSRYRIGYWHWEQPQLPDSALRAFEHVDEVWVPSTFVHEAVMAVSPVPVVKIPHAISFAVTPGLRRQSFGLPENKFLVLVMYDFNSYQYRKNPQAALEAFAKVAANRKDAALVIKTISGPTHAEALHAMKLSAAHMNNVVFIDTFFTRQQTWDLQSCCDALISLHRAEGFGLVPAEMMFLGKPVIATGWSANVDFMTPDNSFLVRYELKPLAESLGVYPSGPLWANADVDHAAWCLERLLNDANLAKQMGQAAQTDIRRQLNPETVGALIRKRLTLLGFWNPHLKL
jgi:glycosyltransferase involved in cell wall biosynthesis